MDSEEKSLKEDVAQNFINILVNAVKLEFKVRDIREAGNEADVEKYYECQDALEKEYDKLVHMEEVQLSRLIAADLCSEALSAYTNGLQDWVKDVKEDIPRYMVRDPLEELSSKVKALETQMRRLEIASGVNLSSPPLGQTVVVPPVPEAEMEMGMGTGDVVMDSEFWY